MNVINWIQENWTYVLLAESTIASFIPVKYNGILNIVWDIIQNGVAPKTTNAQNTTAQKNIQP